MKRFFPLTVLLILVCGCASMTSTTERVPIFAQGYSIGTNTVPIAYQEKTTLRVRTVFDAQAQVAKTGNRSGYTTNGVWGPGTYASGINEASNTTNLVDILNAVAQGVATGVVKGVKP